MSTKNTILEKIHISGQVQGVGFRPYIFTIAQQLKIKGEVKNDGSGVIIFAQSNKENIQYFINKIKAHPPVLARIDNIKRQQLEGSSVYTSFTISASELNTIETDITADAATCYDCLSEINTKANRRYAYPFTNCTHCGPRLSIINDIPYDRAHTSMAKFNLCENCSAEYQDVNDRRFHAQPNACPVCGPKLELVDNGGHQVASEDVIATTANLIKQGKVVAIKGIGGFQLACDANNHQAVLTLRERKHREDKAFALMACNIEQIKSYCKLSDLEEAELNSSAAPIVLLQINKTDISALSQAVAPRQNQLGFMLPYSPLHHLLMQQLQQIIVLTSANMCGQPQCTDNEQAIERLADIADYVLLHDRDILNRVDDSVVKFMNNTRFILRRARGFAPQSISIEKSLATDKQILACGSELKNTFCLLKGQKAVLSQHMGDLENMQSYDDYLYNISLYKKLYHFEPQCIVVDKHPEYLSSKYGRELSQTLNIPLIEVQHHHAHLAACLADNHWRREQGKVIGVALDGLGYGEQQQLWGGEFLVVDYLAYELKARLKPTPLIGGEKAMLQPWRNTFAQLYYHDDWQMILRQFSNLPFMINLSSHPLMVLENMLKTNTNTVMSSSCGRLFDAVAFSLGICPQQQSYEGQAAIELESLLVENDLLNEQPYPFELEQQDITLINPKLMWQALLNDLKINTPIAKIAARFHLGLAQIIVNMVLKISQQTAIYTVALSGGVFQNRFLMQLCVTQLKQHQLQVLIHHQVPTNDGGLSLGQAVIAAARLVQKG